MKTKIETMMMPEAAVMPVASMAGAPGVGLVGGAGLAMPRGRLVMPASMSRARGASLLVALALAGCAAVGPDYQKPALSLPGQWGPATPADEAAEAARAAGAAASDGSAAGAPEHGDGASKDASVAATGSGADSGTGEPEAGLSPTDKAVRAARKLQAEQLAEAEKTTVSRGQAPALAHWWEQLNDPLLNQLLDEAVAGSPNVATAKARVREARASYRQAGGALWPSLNGSASATRTKAAESAAGAGGTGAAGATTGISTGAYNQYQGGFDTSWELDLFGANRRTLEASGYGLEAADENLRAALLTLVGDVASNYVSARGYQARMALARRTAVSQRETARLTRLRFQAGSTSAVDVANAAGQAAATEANIPELEASWAQAVHRLSVLTGLAPAALIARMRPEGSIPSVRLPMGVGFPADVLNSRPDVRMAERQYAQATANIGAAEAARYPKLTLTGNISTTAMQFGDLGKSSTIGWSIGPSLSIPIFSAGRLAAAVDVARAQRDQYFIAYQSSVLSALEEVENAIVSLSREQVRQKSLTESAGHYRKAASLARSLFRSGASSFLNLLEAERSLYSAEDSLLQSQVASVTNFIALNKALGGGWNGEVDASEPVKIPAAEAKTSAE